MVHLTRRRLAFRVGASRSELRHRDPYPRSLTLNAVGALLRNSVGSEYIERLKPEGKDE